MIARFFLVLPFDIFIPESGEWPMLEIASDVYRARVHFPSVVAERPDATASVIGTVAVKLSTAVFSDNLLVNGKKVARTNVLTVDLLRPEFDRSTNSGLARDPDPGLAFEIANQILARIWAYSRVSEIKPLLIPAASGTPTRTSRWGSTTTRPPPTAVRQRRFRTMRWGM